MATKQIFITQEAANQIDLNKVNLTEATPLPQNSNVFFQNKGNKNKPIYIYDLGFKKKNNIIPVYNHINKTGSNPLRGYRQKAEFYDITQIYQKQKKAKIAMCFGSRPPKEKHGEYVCAQFLCHHTIAAYCAGFKKIFAYVIT